MGVPTYTGGQPLSGSIFGTLVSWHSHSITIHFCHMNWDGKWFKFSVNLTLLHFSSVYISYFHWCLLHFPYYHTSWTKGTCACVNCFYCLPCKIKIVWLSYLETLHIFKPDLKWYGYSSVQIALGRSFCVIHLSCSIRKCVLCWDIYTL